MDLVTLANSQLRLAIAPSLGAGIADFSLFGPMGTWYPLMRRAAPGETNASLLASFFMAPWVNRIAGAAFTFAGRNIPIRPTTAANTPRELVVAQHGDVRKRPWRIVESATTSARLSFDSREHASVNWPWSFRCEATYELGPDALTIDLCVTNTDREAFPAGAGHHPYFPRRLFSDDDLIQLRAPVSGRYPLTNACATGPSVDDDLCRRLRSSLAPLPREVFDGVFAADASMANRAEIHWPASRVTLSIEASQNMRHWVLYAPFVGDSPAAFIAIEPQTQVNGALNHEHAPWTGSIILNPGETLLTNVRFVVQRS